jgi:hypothetical protein
MEEVYIKSLLAILQGGPRGRPKLQQGPQTREKQTIRTTTCSMTESSPAGATEVTKTLAPGGGPHRGTVQEG